MMKSKQKWIIAGITGASLFLGGRMLFHQVSKGIGTILISDPYEENLLEMVSASYRVGIQNIWENNLRAESGQVIQRPLGSPRKFINFNGLSFSPVFLTRLPTPQNVKIDTEIIIGKNCKKPLVLSTPIIIAGMAYGLALSKQAKYALAYGSTLAGTATNTGEGLFLQGERDLAANLIVQYHRGKWKKETDLKQADMIEIQVGQGATVGIGHSTPAKQLSKKQLKQAGLQGQSDVIITAYHEELTKKDGLSQLVKKLRKLTDGVPIGIKFAFNNTIEQEVDIALEAGVDVIALEGGQAATKGAPPILEDDFGLPTMIGLSRVVRHLKKRGMKDQVSLIVSGGIYNPGDMLKAIALGADAVAIGSVALFAISHSQNLKVLPFEPPTQLVWENGKYKHRFKWRQGANDLAKFITSCTLEICEGVRALGKTAIKEINQDDLVALNEEVAAITGIPIAWEPERKPTTIRRHRKP